MMSPRKMFSTKPSSGWVDPQQPRLALRKYGQPLAVYDLSKRQGSQFFTWVGKITLFCLIGSLLFLAVGWAIRQPASADSSIYADVEGNGSPGSDGAKPIVQPPPPDAPVLGYVATWGITSNAAAISWSTNVPATTALAYGTTRSLGQNAPAQATMDITHGVKLAGLKPGTTYYFEAASTGKNGATGKSAITSFTTLPVPNAPVISSIKVVPGKNNKVDISWTTSVPTYSYVQIGSTTAYNRYSTRTNLTKNPHPTFAWVPSGTVHYQLVSTDAYGNQVVSPDYTFVEP